MRFNIENNEETKLQFCNTVAHFQKNTFLLFPVSLLMFLRRINNLSASHVFQQRHFKSSVTFKLLSLKVITSFM